jgi:hypothetical protein
MPKVVERRYLLEDTADQRRRIMSAVLSLNPSELRSNPRKECLVTAKKAPCLLDRETDENGIE